MGRFGGVYRTVRKIAGFPGLVLPRKRPLTDVPNISGDRFGFLAGLHRSGTSITHRLLREHPDTSGFSNTRVPEDEGQYLQTVFARESNKTGPGQFAFSKDMHLTEASPLVTSSNREKLLREWGPYYDLDKKLLLEKTPSNLVRSRFFQALFPGSRFLFIIRHPISVSLSTYDWTRRSGIGLAEVMDHWAVAHSIFLEDVQHIENKMVIRYEDFVADNGRTLAQIHQFFGLEPISAKEAVADYNGKYFQRWECKVKDRAEIAEAFHNKAGCGFLDRFGYQLEAPYTKTGTYPL